MPGGLMLYVAAASLEFDGQRLEGTGVTPDNRIERPLPYAAGADPVLDAAVEHLAKAGAP
jgi:carboxyl-terminal processing protease